MPDTQTQPEQYSYADFAAKIRAKYPQSELYKKKPDKELVDAWVQAKPERAVYVKKIKGYDPNNEKPGVPSQIPVTRAKIGGGTSTRLQDAGKVKKESALVDQVGAGLPSTGSMIGGLLGGGKGPIAAGTSAGGAVLGVAAQDLMKRIVMGDDTLSGKEESVRALKEAVIAGVSQFAGDKVGEGVFYLLNKIPHASIQNGIKFMPHELPGNKNSSVTKYMHDLLTNLVPSAKTMAEDAAKRNSMAIGAAEKLAKSFGRIDGTSEEIGLMVQEALEQQRKLLIQQGAVSKGSNSVQKAFGLTAVQKEYDSVFKTKLAEEISKEYKPEAIVGFIRGTSELEETRTILGFLKDKEKEPVVNAVRRRLMSDILQETLTGTKDPILKQLQRQDTKFVGSKLKDVLDKVGEEKLKVIYGEDGLKRISEFTKLMEHVGSNGSNGTGKFLNLIFLLGPLRTGLTFVAGKKLVTEGFIFNRMAKYMTSTEGIRLTENYARAMSVGIKTLKLVYDEMKAFNDRTDREYIQQQHDTEDLYYKEHPDEVKYRKQEGVK